MKKKQTYLIPLTVCLSAFGLFSLHAGYLSSSASPPEGALHYSLPEAAAPEDTLPPPRYPVAKTIPEDYEELLKQPPADLRDPENVKTAIEYDNRSGMYIVRTKVGDMEVSVPLSLTPEEYRDYSLRQSLHSYFRKKNDEEFQNEEKNRFNLSDLQFDLGAAEKIFGKGGVRLQTQGSAEITLGLKTNTTNNPSLPERSRSRTYFNFDEKVQLNVKASVGSKLNFGMNYNTETSFDFDSKKLNLAYSGEEDEIIKSIEAGNVSMMTGNSLINGGAALFGVKTDMQFGKLRVNALLAQQESESKTVNSKGGVQTKPFEITVDRYDENRHFFLSHYFRDHYDEFVEQLSFIRSPISINRVEVWVTNKRSNFGEARNIVAFTDLAEHDPRHIGNSRFQPSGTNDFPHNGANTLHNDIRTNFPEAREISRVNQVLATVPMEGGREYEKIESARRLSEAEYTVNKQLGYISLRTQLQPDEVLAVAFDYQVGGMAYQVGEFSTDNVENTAASLFVKLLKGTTLSPDMMYWNLMMKNVYSLDAYSVQKEKFRLDILYQSDTTGIYLNYLQEGDVNGLILLRVMNLDRLDARDNPYPDGFFDFVQGVTALPENGRIIFPSVEPFGSYLRKKIGNDNIADKYVYQELYDSTLTVARQIAEKNKFILRGEYKASSGSEIQLEASNVARGSVRVMAGGVLLTENVDYTVDYTSGTVTILNENLSGSQISVSLENQSMYSMQRKTMMGVDLQYQFSKDFLLGGTLMHLSEMPLTTKTAFGDESIRNTLWGVNTAYKGESQWLTNLVDKLPLLTLTKPSQISFNAEFAHLIAGHYENKYTGGYSYLDDFESTQSGIDLLQPYPWNLASTPYEAFDEARAVNDLTYGKNRALLAWYYIDGMFTRTNSSLMPSYLKRDREQLSNHYVRSVRSDELFPNRQLGYNENNILPVLNVAYYPNERGPYNLIADELDEEGWLREPQKRWGGMMRKLDQTDFEASNIEYIEFWMLDPYIYKPQSEGGYLYFNLGEVSEDILKDEKKFYENGLPIDGDTAKVEQTVWGRVPRQQSTVYAFDNSAGAREVQDVGLDGLSSADEQTHHAAYLQQLQGRLTPDAYQRISADPSADDFMHYRNSLFDREETSILDRYKRYNGTEGNSRSNDTNEQYNGSSRSVPDVEDLNQDNTMNENEKYFQYRIRLHPDSMNVGMNYIVNERTATVRLENSGEESVTWYQFKVPVKEYTRAVGSIRDFKTIRFMRLYMTGFRDTTILRFGTFKLVRGEWRSYGQDLARRGTAPAINGTLDVSTVNIEENGDRQPVNYVLPPGITRMIDPGQPQITKQNEQALSMKITNLASQDARAVYKNTFYDFRQYKRMQLFTHAEALINDVTDLRNDELSVFIRLGSDYKNNYYEYEVPLALTPHSNTYNTNNAGDQEAVWPRNNLLDFRLETLTGLKLRRNRAKSEGVGGVTYQTPYSEYDPDNTRNTVTVVGNPSLAEVKVIMIGIRNNSNSLKSAEVWINELRISDFNESGGWAANGSLNIALSDLGTVNLAGRIETAGFGGLDQTLNQRRLDDYTQYSVATSVELGKFFPAKTNVSIPLYYAYSKEVIDPKYNPLDQDVKLKEALDAVATKSERDSILNFARERTNTKSIALNNVKVDIRSKNPMPYDPANFSLGYSYSESQRNKPDTEYETTKDYRANFGYTYTPYAKPLRPFEKLKQNNNYLKQLSISYLPATITFQTSLVRNYYEIQLRDLNNTTGSNNLPVSFSQNFYWDRAFSLSWNFTNDLKATFTSGTNARIEEPHVQVNKRLNPDQYQVWKDSIRQSIADLGTPMKYDQSLKVTWNVPFQRLPGLDWMTTGITYNATYNWDRGAIIDTNTELGNIIRNHREEGIQANFGLVNLYNKSKFLRSVNQKFSGSTRTAPATRNRTGLPQTAADRNRQKKVEKEVQLSPDSATFLKHDLKTKRLLVTAKGAGGKRYTVKFKAVDDTQIRILNRDTAKLNVTVYPKPPLSENFLYQTAEYGARFLMMIRQMGIQYTLTDGMMIPGFRPEIGDMFGQGRSTGGLTPGLGFAFGATNRSYIDKLIARDHLVMNSNNINPAIINSAKNLKATMFLEPAAGLKINLNVDRVDTRNTTVQYMYKGRPEIYGGTFTMTTIALGTSFKGIGNAQNGYASPTFETFLNNRKIIAERLENAYAGTSYPQTGFFAGTSFAGQPYSPLNGGVKENATDVLIPAFLAAYTGRSAKSITLSPFPSLASLLPNWRITYDGLVRLPGIKKYFKSVVLSHQYRGSYSVGSYNSSLDWVSAGNGLGFTLDKQTNDILPSSPYVIGTVSIIEGFTPLFGVEGTLLNNITLQADYRTTRTLNLNISSYQIIEAVSDEYKVGVGYTYAEFNKILKMKKSRDFSNDLTVKLDYSYKKMQSLIRKISDNLTQATSGNQAKVIQFSAEYGLSRSLTLRAFYDLQINQPLVSSNAYPTTNSSYGITIRFSLTQ
ncbi:MAG: cell surface protein SprA [Tannerellaceae bacterium]|jgi:cell surface protein SprA|nr:cell surface protein SprA [Tannerellaceae bacterium]